MINWSGVGKKGKVEREALDSNPGVVGSETTFSPTGQSRFYYIFNAFSL